MPAKRIIITIPDEDKLWLDGYAKECQDFGWLRLFVKGLVC